MHYSIIMLLIYGFLMISITLLFTKKEKTTEGFYVGQGTMGVFPSAMSIAATWIWAPALFISAEKAYLYGLTGLFWFLVPNVLCLVIFIPFAKRIRQRMPRGTTLSGFMEKTYRSKRVKQVYLFQLGSLTVLSTAVQLLAGGKVLSSMTGIPFISISLLLGLIAYSYSWFSGIKASIFTDTLQMSFILLGCMLFIPWVLIEGNGVENLIKGFSGVSKEYTSLLSPKSIEVFFAFGLPATIGLIAGPFGDQCFWQRTFAVKKNKIGKSFALGAIIFAVAPLSMGILGLIAAGSGFISVDKSFVNLELMTYLFPKWAMIPFLLMILSGLLSTVDSNLCAMASLTSDLEFTKKMNPNQKIKCGRWSMVVLLIVSNVVANIPHLTLTHLFLFYGILRATTFLPTILTLLDKKLSATGIVVGIVLAMGIGLPIFVYGSMYDLSLWKIVGSLTALLLGGMIALIITRIEVKKYGQ